MARVGRNSQVKARKYRTLTFANVAFACLPLHKQQVLLCRGMKVRSFFSLTRPVVPAKSYLLSDFCQLFDSPELCFRITFLAYCFGIGYLSIIKHTHISARMNYKNDKKAEKNHFVCFCIFKLYILTMKQRVADLISCESDGNTLGWSGRLQQQIVKLCCDSCD